MPFYDYRCEECAETFEERRPIDRRDEAVCPECGSRKVKRLVSRVNTPVRAGGCGPTRSGGG